MLKLVIITGPDKGRHVRVGDAEPLTIGRDRGRLRLHDSRCSKRHAEIKYIGGTWVLRDTGSSNGTFLNQEQLGGLAELERGDIIQCGRIAMRVRQADATGMTTLADGPAVGFAEPAADIALPDVVETPPQRAAESPLAPPAETAGEEFDLDAMFEEADRADGNDALADDDDDMEIASIDAPAPVEDVLDAPIEMEPSASMLDGSDVGRAAEAAADDVAEHALDSGHDADAERIDDASDDSQLPGDLLIESGIFDPVPGAAGWGPEPAADVSDVVDDVDVENEVSVDDAGEAAAVGPSADGDAIDANAAAQVEGEVHAADESTEDSAAQEDESEAEENPSDASLPADSDEPSPGDLSDQVLIDDELPDAGKMPGTTQVLPSETLAAAAGSDRSAALANQSDAYEAEEESIGLADDEPVPSVFDDATQAKGDAPVAEDEAVDTHDDLIRISDDEPIVREPAAAVSQVYDAIDAQSDVLPIPDDEATQEHDVKAEDEAEVEVEDEAAAQNVVEAQAIDPGEVVADDIAEDATEDAAQVASEVEPPTQDADDAADTDVSAVAPAHAAHTADDAQAQADKSEDLDALRAALAKLEDADEASAEPDSEHAPAAVAADDAEDETAAQAVAPATQSDDIAEDAEDTDADADADIAAFVNTFDQDDDAFDLDDDSADAEIAAALEDDVDETAPPLAEDRASEIDAPSGALADDAPHLDDGSSHPPQTTDNTSVNEASTAPPVLADDADLERIDDIDTAAQAELDPSETDYDAPLPASFGPNAGSASAVGRELDADTQQEHAALADALPLDTFADTDTVDDAPADTPRATKPSAHDQNPTTTLPPVEPKRSYRSAGPPPKPGHTLKRLGFAAAILFVLGLCAALYFGVIDTQAITGKANRPTETDTLGPGSSNPADPGIDPLAQRNPSPADAEIPRVPSGDRLIEPPTQTPVDPTPSLDSTTSVAGIARTPDPFDNAPRVLGEDALAGRTTDDRRVIHPDAPGPDQNLLNPGPKPVPPIIFPQPGGTTNPPNPADPGNANTQPSNTPESADANNTQPADTNIDPTASIDGDRLVFLVDCSGSLVDSLPQMLLWLHEAIATLEDGETFTIIFFQKDLAMEPSPAGLKPLTRAYLRDLDREWLDPNASPILPAGRSDPAAAFELALTYEPSDIYLLSDESFAQRAGDTTSEEAVTFITQTMGDADVRLHGVQFFYDSGDSTLQTLSEQFDGSYEFVAETRHPDRDPIDLLEELENRNP